MILKKETYLLLPCSSGCFSGSQGALRSKLSSSSCGRCSNKYDRKLGEQSQSTSDCKFKRLVWIGIKVLSSGRTSSLSRV
jgi:hypothetical protein